MNFASLRLASCSLAALTAAAWADTTDVTWKSQVVIEKAGEFCSDDPNCFNHYHPDIPTVAIEGTERVVSGLEAELPEAPARVARGPRPQRIASLIGTGQLFVTVLLADKAVRMARAEAPFEGYPPTPVQALAALDAGYLLCAARR